ncbi:hypothetical protein Ahy_B06g083040 isoform B [Arachis hypogaea]|uniref:Uncharacterized protein n=1 Tax=Arachis hypogaea TaxID=3818 RepID=A0A444YPD2_ARAHY|nr:hypothetical protein Ahy_B06g083040 isoform A [Arachis hypogaea]RYR03767.1 hypothetical protein Ahy_B06g083040 isoform B [Arachis hypogaea]
MRKYHHSLAFTALQFAFAVLHFPFAFAVYRLPFAVRRPPRPSLPLFHEYKTLIYSVLFTFCGQIATDHSNLELSRQGNQNFHGFRINHSGHRRPVEKNEYFVLDDEEEEAAEMALREEKFEL